MTALRVCLISIIFTCLYVFSTVLISCIIMHNQANGSFIKTNNKIIGSKFIGQEFTSNKYFHGRPSLNHYKNDISGNSNFPFYSKELTENTLNNLKKYRSNAIDANLITESASGLDTHITYNGALLQIDRIAQSRGIAKEELLKLINKNAKPHIFGIFGEKIVHVLELNISLDNVK